MTTAAHTDALAGNTHELGTHELRLVEQVARRVVELLRLEGLGQDATKPLVDAATLARDLGVSRPFVYAHKAELGGVALGTGPRPRWGFDLAEARRRLAARSASERALSANIPVAATTLPLRRRVRKGDGAHLLPIRGDRRAA
jgi:hypothetical protein